jgi:hypothetical protein
MMRGSIGLCCFKGGVELAKGGDISSSLSAIISIIQKKRQPRSRLSPISAVFFSGVEVEQAVLVVFCPKELFF